MYQATKPPTKKQRFFYENFITRVFTWLLGSAVRVKIHVSGPSVRTEQVAVSVYRFYVAGMRIVQSVWVKIPQRPGRVQP